MNRDRQLNFGENVRVEVIDSELASPLDHAKAIAKQRTLDDCDEAFLLGDLSAVAAQLRRWRARMPRVEPFYAVKCNDDPAVLRTLAILGTGFDCASKSELRRVLQLGVPSERIIYANPCKQVSMIRFARDSNVPLMTFDNIEELHKIKEHYPEAKMVLRILPQAVKAQCVLGNKFGAPYEAVARLIHTAKALAVDVVGVSFHVGSGCQDAQGYAYALQLARRVFDDLIAADFQPYLIDVGGGFPGTDNDALSFEEIADVLVPALDELFPASSGVQVIGEPGRFMVTRAFTLMTSVIAKRTPNASSAASSSSTSANSDAAAHSGTSCVPSQPTGPSTSAQSTADARFFYYLNDGVYGSFNCIFFDHCTLRASVAKRVPDSAPRFASSLYGPTCDGLDCVMQETWLPELAVGDWVYFENMGAYTLVSASEFNGMPRATRFYVVNKTDAALFHREFAATIAENGGAISADLAALVDESLLAEICKAVASPPVGSVNVAEHQLELSSASQSFTVNDATSELKTVLREFREQAVQRSEGDLAANGEAAAIAQLETLLNAMGAAEAQSACVFGDETPIGDGDAASGHEHADSASATKNETDESLSTCSEAARESVSTSTVGDSDMLADESAMPAVTLIFD